MNTMDYHISFQPKSPLITPLHSDTLFGHVAWAVRYLWEESRLIKFLGEFQDGGDAPFLISDGFPAGYLPKPFFKAMPLVELRRIVRETFRELNAELNPEDETQLLKELKRQSLFRLETFKQIQADCSAAALLKASAKEFGQLPATGKRSEKRKELATIVTHNTVNRIYGTVIEGLYQQTENFYAEDFSFEAYLKTSFFSHKELEQIFSLIEHTGYGRDKSTGKGKFAITVRATSVLPAIADANAFMVLSHYVPNAAAPQAGYYRLMTKYGRLGGDYASSVIPGINKYYGGSPPKVHPFKKPLVMIRPGSVFLGKPADHHGLLLGGEQRSPALQIHKFPGIRHYAYAFPVGLKVKEEDFGL